jgi:hypothetical protein
MAEQVIVKYDVRIEGLGGKYAPGMLLHSSTSTANREVANARKAGFKAERVDVLVKVG